jgi:nucleotidyltransferase substrate binding protein (TIGR01987 family)
MIEYDKFQKALKHLEVQFENYRTLDENLPELIHEGIAESVIQRFETCWDCLWKVLKRYLEEEIGLPEVPNGPNPILRLANENNLLPETLENWLGYAKARVNTSHDYSGEKAQDALAIMGDFVNDAIGLYQTMSGESWE